MNPYRIEGPAIISFSGGRTSAMMLYRIPAEGTGHGHRFRANRPSYRAMYEMASDQGEMFCFDDGIEDCACTD